MIQEQLNKNLEEILSYSHDYVVPLYQRNYAWGAEEIFQLIQDIYEHFKKDPKENYFIGTLVVLRRKNGDYEVIDGQQRLTTISLLAKYLAGDRIKKPKLKYDSRQEVEDFLSVYYQNPRRIEGLKHSSISHFVNAIEYIKAVVLNPKDELNFIQLETFKNYKEYIDFVRYFFEQVILVRVEIPQDTDVAHYFEVMNNRGEQLVPHEILKARLLEKIEDKKQAQIFAQIWEACSQMDSHIQSHFNPTERVLFFEKGYSGFVFNKVVSEKIETDKQKLTSINAILVDEGIEKKEERTSLKYKLTKYNSIIDFSNFLMQVLRLRYNDVFGLDGIPLNGDELLSVFEALEVHIDSMDFIRSLFFYKVVFDRFIVKTFEDDQLEDNAKWTLRKPEYYYYENREQDRLVFKNAFENEAKQHTIIKCLSMLQVTFRTKKYKNWLQNILGWFGDAKDLEISAEDYLRKLNALVLTIFSSNQNLLSICTRKTIDADYAEGTNTPHFLFNFIDYLLWMKNPSDFNFEFKYRNSVEHHLPQSLENAAFVHSLGNLCLVSKRANSRMGNENAVGKAKKTNGKYYKENLPPKQKLMYDKTNEGDWGKVEIKAHYNEIVNVLKDRNKILEHHEG